MTLGELIKEYRQEHGLSQGAIASASGLSKAYISILERNRNPKTGEPPIASLKTIKSIAKALGSDFDTIFSKLDPDIKVSLSEQMPPPLPPGFDPLPNTVKKPLVGSIACGTPITAEENIEDYVDVPDDIHCDFCLLCKGDSMIEAGIHNGDVVYIRKQPTVEDGEIAAVRIDGEATLKRVFWDKEQQILQLIPCNRNMPSKVYSGPVLETVQIEGKAVGYTHLF